jgi:RNA polymerase sigma-70 factor (ECF subfamily)
MPTGRARDDARAAAFERFHAEMRSDAARYAATILGPRQFDGLDDVLQEAWSRAWRAWDDSDPERRTAWFLRIVRNCCIDQHRGRRPTVPLAPGPGNEGDAGRLPAAHEIEDAIVARVDADRTWSLLGRLPAPLREVLWLREVADMSYAEIADVQGVPLGTVMSRLHAARRRAARLLRGPQ